MPTTTGLQESFSIEVLTRAGNALDEDDFHDTATLYVTNNQTGARHTLEFKTNGDARASVSNLQSTAWGLINDSISQGNTVEAAVQHASNTLSPKLTGFRAGSAPSNYVPPATIGTQPFSAEITTAASSPYDGDYHSRATLYVTDNATGATHTFEFSTNGDAGLYKEAIEARARALITEGVEKGQTVAEAAKAASATMSPQLTASRVGNITNRAVPAQSVAIDDEPAPPPVQTPVDQPPELIHENQAPATDSPAQQAPAAPLPPGEAPTQAPQINEDAPASPAVTPPSDLPPIMAATEVQQPAVRLHNVTVNTENNAPVVNFVGGNREDVTRFMKENNLKPDFFDITERINSQGVPVVSAVSKNPQPLGRSQNSATTDLLQHASNTLPAEDLPTKGMPPRRTPAAAPETPGRGFTNTDVSGNRNAGYVAGDILAAPADAIANIVKQADHYVSKVAGHVEEFAGSEVMGKANMFAGGVQAISSFSNGDNVGGTAGVAQTLVGAYADSLSAGGNVGAAAKANIVGGIISAGAQGYSTYQETGDLGEAFKAGGKSAAMTAGTAVVMAAAPVVAGKTAVLVTTALGAEAATAISAGTVATTVMATTLTVVAVAGAGTAAAVAGYKIGSAIEDKAEISQGVADKFAEANAITDSLSADMGKGTNIATYKNLNNVRADLLVRNGSTYARENLDRVIPPSELRIHINEMREEAQKLDGGGISNWAHKKITGDDLSERGQALKSLASAETELGLYEKQYNKQMAPKPQAPQAEPQINYVLASSVNTHNQPAQSQNTASAPGQNPQPEKPKDPALLALENARANGNNVGLQGRASSDGKHMPEVAQVSTPQVNARSQGQQQGAAIA